MESQSAIILKRTITFAVVILLVSIACSVSAENAGKKTVIKRYSTTASKPSGFLMPGEKKIQFKFSNSEISGWVRKNGQWFIEGVISHTNFFCADYSLGMRFGEGHPGCIDVKWLTEDQFATHEKQCNNVRMNHSGYQSNTDITTFFDKISCAQAVVKCVGTCK